MTNEEAFKPVGTVVPHMNELSVILAPNRETSEQEYQRFFVGYPVHTETVSSSLTLTRFRCVIYIGHIEDDQGNVRYLAESVSDIDNDKVCGRLMEIADAKVQSFSTQSKQFKEEVIKRLETILNNPKEFKIAKEYAGFNKEIHVETFLKDALVDMGIAENTYPETERIKVVLPKNLCYVRYANMNDIGLETFSTLNSLSFNPSQIYVGYKDPKFGTFILSDLKFDSVNKVYRFKSLLVQDAKGIIRGKNFCSILPPVSKPTLDKVSCIEILDYKKSSELFGYRKIKSQMINKIYSTYHIRTRFKCNKDGLFRDIIEIYNPEIKRSIKFTASEVKIHIIDTSRITKGIQLKKDRTIEVKTKVYISPKVARVYNIPNKAVATVTQIDFSKQKSFKSKYTGKQVDTIKNCYAQLLTEDQKDIICQVKYLKRI